VATAIHSTTSVPTPDENTQVVDPGARAEEYARRWRVGIDHAFETNGSLIAYGRRDEQPVVLKVARARGDEWRSGETLRAFAGRGVVPVIEHADGAVLLERLNPGISLAALAVEGRDGEATSILASVISAMSPDMPPAATPTVLDWARGFARYRESGDGQIPYALVDQAEALYLELCASQHRPRLLHGDLQHYNVLYDRVRGWVAIDPKGVVGELEYEIGASLRNPIEAPALFTSATVLRARIDRLCGALGLDPRRALAWAFAQAVLSAIWRIEDDGPVVRASDPVLVLARAARRMLDLHR
jgi:streptomycin 6-kinase